MIGLAKGCRNLKGFEIDVDISIKVQLALLSELHYRRPDRELATEAHLKRWIGRCFLPFIEIRISIALAEDDPAVFDDRHCSAGMW